jgi:hypothetical protein
MDFNKKHELMRKNDNLDTVAAILASTYLLKTTDACDFNNDDLYVNTYLRMKAHLINMLDE